MRNEKQDDKVDRAAARLEGLIALMAATVSAFLLTVVAWSAIQLFAY